VHPLLQLAATRPQLLAEHAEAYAELAAAEAGAALAAWRRQTVLAAVALASLGVAAVLAGVALMLWAVVPPADIQAPWALVAAPLLPAALSVACLLASRQRRGDGSFDILREQFMADLMMLREVPAA
jgi:hypothetical protein